jgi:hypothetical protein
MKKQHVLIGIGILAVVLATAVLGGAAGGLLVYACLSPRETPRPEPAPVQAPWAGDKAVKPPVEELVELAMNKPVKRTKPAPETVRPEHLPPEVVALAQRAMPNADIEVDQASTGKGVYNLRLTADGSTVSARFTQTRNEVAGTVRRDMPASEMPSDVVNAFRQAAPTGVIGSAFRVVAVGGQRDGEVSYEWTWNGNCSGTASADGRQMTVRDRVDSQQVPAAVTEAVGRAFPQAVVGQGAERVIENGVTRYVIGIVPAGGKKSLVAVSGTGEILR